MNSFSSRAVQNLAKSFPNPLCSSSVSRPYWFHLVATGLGGAEKVEEPAKSSAEMIFLRIIAPMECWDLFQTRQAILIGVT